jgi:hypothetical protein
MLLPLHNHHHHYQSHRSYQHSWLTPALHYRLTLTLKSMEYANYLPDELLLEVLEYIDHYPTLKRQSTLARFCGVNRQWYDVGIRKLYEAPYLSGRAYELFVRTVCPSVIAHIKPSSLSGLVKCLDLSHIVHNGNKATTARTSKFSNTLLMAYDMMWC